MRASARHVARVDCFLAFPFIFWSSWSNNERKQKWQSRCKFLYPFQESIFGRYIKPKMMVRNQSFRFSCCWLKLARVHSQFSFRSRNESLFGSHQSKWCVSVFFLFDMLALEFIRSSFSVSGIEFWRQKSVGSLVVITMTRCHLC